MHSVDELSGFADARVFVMRGNVLHCSTWRTISIDIRNMSFPFDLNIETTDRATILEGD